MKTSAGPYSRAPECRIPGTCPALGDGPETFMHLVSWSQREARQVKGLGLENSQTHMVLENLSQVGMEMSM